MISLCCADGWGPVYIGSPFARVQSLGTLQRGKGELLGPLLPLEKMQHKKLGCLHLVFFMDHKQFVGLVNQTILDKVVFDSQTTYHPALIGEQRALSWPRFNSGGLLQHTTNSLHSAGNSCNHPGSGEPEARLGNGVFPA